MDDVELDDEDVDAEDELAAGVLEPVELAADGELDDELDVVLDVMVEEEPEPRESVR